MDSAGVRRPSFVKTPSSSLQATVLSTASNLDAYQNNHRPVGPGSPQPPTPEAIRSYRQRQYLRGTGGPAQLGGSNLNAGDRLAQPHHTFVRSFSGPTPPSYHSSTLPVPGISQKASIKDLVAKFNNVGLSDSTSQATRPLVSPTTSQSGRFPEVESRIGSRHNISSSDGDTEQLQPMRSRNDLSLPTSPGSDSIALSFNVEQTHSTSENTTVPHMAVDLSAYRPESASGQTVGGSERPADGTHHHPTQSRRASHGFGYQPATRYARKGSHESLELSPIPPDEWHFNPDYLRASPKTLAHKRSQSDSLSLQSSLPFQPPVRQQFLGQIEDLDGAQAPRFFKPPSPPSRLPVRSSRVRSAGPGLPTVESFAAITATPPKSRSSRRHNPSSGAARTSGQRLKAVITTSLPQKSPPLRSSRPRQFVSAATRYAAQDPFVARASTAFASNSSGFPVSDSSKVFGEDSSDGVRSPDRLARVSTSQEPAMSTASDATPVSATWSFEESPVQPRSQHMIISHMDLANHLGMAGGRSSHSDATKEEITALPESPGVVHGSSKVRKFFTPSHSRNVSELEKVQTAPGMAEFDDNVKEEKPNLLNQILGLRRDASPPAKRSRLSTAPEALPTEGDNGDTIQIMLSKTPELKRLSERWGQDSRNNKKTSPINEPRTPPRSSQAYTPMSGTPTRSSGQRVRSTMDSDSYSIIYRLLEQYHEVGAVSPAMVDEFHQHILETDPDLSCRDDSESLQIAKVALEGLIREHSRGSLFTDGSQASPLRDYLRTRSHLSAASLDPPLSLSYPDSPSAQAVALKIEEENTIEKEEAIEMDDGFTPMNNVLHQMFGNQTVVPIDQANDEETGPTPPPKDDAYKAPFTLTSNESMRTIEPAKDQLPNLQHPPPQAQPRMQLPEIQGTGGGLGLAIGFEQPHALPIPRQTASSTSSFSDVSRFRSSSYSAKTLPNQSFSSQSTPPSDMARYISESSAATPTRPSRDTPPSSASQNASVHRDSVAELTKPHSMTEAETKRLKERRHIIKELIDTEYSFSQDMKIVRDIYMTTAPDTIPSAEERRTLFGNTKEVVILSEDFFAALRDAVKGVYIKPRDNRFRDKRNSFPSCSYTTSEQPIGDGFEALDDEADRNTSIAEAFTTHLKRMERVYGDYTRNADAANDRLSQLEQIEAVNVWLAMCYENARDLTTAWNLDSLIVKPTQRFLKYYLMLEKLLEQTPENHPDYHKITIVMQEIKNISERMNQRKARAETLDVILNKKEPPVKFDFKGFGRRKEKLLQQVGAASAAEDIDYLKVSEKFGGQLFQLTIVKKDFELYTATTKAFVQQFQRFIDGTEACLEVGKTGHPDLEKKWKRFGLAIRELIAGAWPDHETDVRKHCIEPLNRLIKLHEEPERMMARRKARLVDYAKFKTLKERGEKIDKKTMIQGEEFNVLNDTLKDELPRLYFLSRDLARACLLSFVEVQRQWHRNWHDKISRMLGQHNIPKSMADVVEVYLSDFAYPEAQAVCLGICNGSILADTSNFLSPTSTLAGSFDDLSKRPSLGGSRKTTSVNSQQSPVIAAPDFMRGSNGSFPSAPYTEHPNATTDQRTLLSFPNGNSPVQPRRARAVSNLSNREVAPSTFGSASPTLPISRTNSNKASSWRNFGQSRNSTSGSAAGSRLSDGSSKLQRGVSSPQFSTTIHTRSREPVTPPLPPQPASQPKNSSLMNDSPVTSSPHSNPIPKTSATRRSATMAFSSALPMSDSRTASPERPAVGGVSEFSSDAPIDPSYSDPESMIQTLPAQQYKVLFLAASLFEFNIDRQMSRAGLPYLTYVPGEIFDVIGQNGELWLARNQDDGSGAIGWIWERHFAKLMDNQDEKSAAA